MDGNHIAIVFFQVLIHILAKLLDQFLYVQARVGQLQHRGDSTQKATLTNLQGL